MYAKWNQITTNTKTVTFNSGGGSAVSAQYVSIGGKVTEPQNVTRTNYALDGWYMNESLTNQWDFANDTVSVDMTLYAKWTRVYTVTFNSNGGSSVTAQIIRTGEKAVEPQGVAREDYIVIGWYRDNTAFQNQWNFATDAVTQDITLYAKWTSFVLERVFVPGGSFQMGNPDSSIGISEERPVHTVTLSGFYIGKYEVTQAQWYAVMGTTIEQLQASIYGSGSNSYGRGDAYPVYFVNWYDALVFCNKLSMMMGLTPAYRINNSTDPAAWGSVPTESNITWNAVTIVSGSTGYRLPTEAQWEYAAKGGNGSPGNYTYAGSNNPDEVAWWYSNSEWVSHAVGTKAPNGLGIYDMSGNVKEWCWDRFGNYQNETQTNPTGASSGYLRVLRGGSWYDDGQGLRSAMRNAAIPSNRYDDIGFRLVRPAQ